MSKQLLTKLPAITETAMDFDTVVAEIKEIIRNNSNWSDNWTDFTNSEAGIMMIDLFAWIADNMSSRQDLLFNEMFIGTAKSDLNKIRHLKQIGYLPMMAHSAKVPLKITFESTLNGKLYIVKPSNGKRLSLRKGEIALFQGKDINARQAPWEIFKLKDGKPDYLGGVCLDSGGTEYYEDDTGNVIYAFQGETHELSGIIKSGNGEYFNINDKNVASDSIQVYIEGNPEPLLQVKSFLSMEAMDKNSPLPYVVEMNEDRSYRVRFANRNIAKPEKLVPIDSKIHIFYRTCAGERGNVQSGIINSNGIEYTDEFGTAILANITNELPAIGGTNEETLNDAVMNGPLNLITMNRAVTPNDYDIILNNNTNIFKSKTYTSSNQPIKFKDYYGRYINPQESFIFTMLNKNYKNVPTEKYNYFPWINTIKEPRINEKYIFDNGEFNKETELGKTFFNVIVQENGNANLLKFKNATVINVGNTFNNSLYLDSEEKKENDYLRLKLIKEKTDQLYFDEILFNIFSDKKPSKLTYLSMKNNYVYYDDNARFLPQESSLLDKPIDVSKARYLSFVVDDSLILTKIDFWSQFNPTNMPERAYLKWDNSNGDRYDEYVNSPSEDAANYRLGIKQIINKSINSAVNESTGGEFEYVNKTSKQRFGLDLMNSTDIINTKLLNKTELHFSLEMNKTIYLFDMKKDQVIASDWGTMASFTTFLNKCFSGEIAVNKFVNDIRVPIDEGELSGYKAIIATTRKDGESFRTHDLCIVNRNKDLNDPVLNIRMSYRKNGYEHILENVLDIQDPQSTAIKPEYEGDVYEGLFMTLKDLSFSGRRDNENIPIPTQAAVYENLADIVEYTSEDKNRKIRLRIKSPTKGIDSSLYFKTEKGEGYTDFAKEILKAIFVKNSKESIKVYGEKKAYLMKKNALSAKEEGSSSNILITKGNVIFENSCMFNEPDFSAVFANYKLKELNKLKIGESYDNFYYTGDSSKDKQIKSDIIGILGQSMYYTELDNGEKTYHIDKERSRLNIKFTKDIKNTNSLFAIEDNLGVVASDVVEFCSNERGIDGNIGSANIVVSIDDLSEIEIPTVNVSNGKDFIKAAKDKVMEMLRDNPDDENIIKIKNNFNSLFKLSYQNAQQIIINSLSNYNGKIIFKYCLSGTVEDNQRAYKVLLGTNKTNKDFYTLYYKELFNERNIVYESEEEYYYCPTIDDPLELTFRKLVNNNGVVESRKADYIIEIEENNSTESSKPSYNFYLKKPEGSKFPDNYFYMHFINDKTYDYDKKGEKIKETDESVLQNYMYKHKVSGTDITFLQPYFRTYDIEATVQYNGNSEEEIVKSSIKEAIEKLCGLDNAKIAGSMSVTRIATAINNCPGVMGCSIDFFGYNIKDPNGNVKELKADFFEVILIHETDEKSGKGLKLKLESQ